MKKQDVVNAILKDRNHTPKDELDSAYAPSNIALCKYWGKRNQELNLPVNSSLSISLANKGCLTVIKIADGHHDKIFMNEKLLDNNHHFVKRVTDYLDLFRKHYHFEIHTQNTIPIAAGLASSASGFAALAESLNLLFDWKLSDKELSIIARLGSGSACRSIYHGFATWHKGDRADGMDSYATPLNHRWEDLRIGLLIFDAREKPISSRDAMQHCVETSRYFNQWSKTAEHDINILQQAVVDNDFKTLGQTAESNALAMHSCMLAATPPVLYWQTATLEAMKKIWQLRTDGIEVYFTEDAGPNIKLIFQAKDTAQIREAFTHVEIVEPFNHHD